MADQVALSPLADLERLPFEAPGIALAELPAEGHLNLRGDDGDAGFAAAMQSTLALSLPREPNTVTSAGAWRACWLAPDEWLLRGRDEVAARSALRELDNALAGQDYALNDISSAQTVLRLQGIRVREVLSKGCTLDLHPRAMGPGDCAQSHLAQAVVLLMPVAEDSFEVVVRRSFADYLARWLLDACA